MTQEALKLALEALETELSIDWTSNDEFNASAEKMYKAIAAIKEALAQTQEPVAWYVKSKDGEPLVGSEPSLYREEAEEILAGLIENSGCEIAPLYSHPQPKQEPVADDFFRMIADRNPKPFSSLQRTWVGLTDVEIDYLLGSTAGENEETHISFARAIEAKLKERNDHSI